MSTHNTNNTNTTTTHDATTDPAPNSTITNPHSQTLSAMKSTRQPYSLYQTPVPSLSQSHHPASSRTSKKPNPITIPGHKSHTNLRRHPRNDDSESQSPPPQDRVDSHLALLPVNMRSVDEEKGDVTQPIAKSNSHLNKHTQGIHEKRAELVQQAQIYEPGSDHENCILQQIDQLDAKLKKTQ
jgi:hypothetical protein